MSLPERNNKLPPPGNIPDMSLPPKSVPPEPEAYGLSAQPTSGWKKGDRVLAPWEPMFLYAGTIDKVAGEQALIEFDDGDAGWVFVAEMQRLQLKRGQHVLSRRKMGLTFYPGEIREVEGENIVVRFDDGHADERTTVAAVRVPAGETCHAAEQVKVKSNTAFLRHLRAGYRVWALWGDGALFVGTVTELGEGRVHIKFDDGDQSWVRHEHLMPLDIQVGLFVVSRWKMGQQYFPGRVTAVKGDRVHIRFDDGDEEWTTTAALAIPVQPPPGAAPAAPASSGRMWYWIVPVLVGLAFVFGKYGCQ